MSRIQVVLYSKREQILQTAARFGIQRVRVFGSVARGMDDEHSDVDFLVELTPTAVCSTWVVSSTKCVLC